MTESQRMESEAIWHDDVLKALKPLGFAYHGYDPAYLGATFSKGSIRVTVSGLSTWRIESRLDKYWSYGHNLKALLEELQKNEHSSKH